MSSKVIDLMDKENSGGMFLLNQKMSMSSSSSSSNGRSFGELAKNRDIKSSHLTTPKLNCEKIANQKHHSLVQSKQRKALGDVFNTTANNKQIFATPIDQKSQSTPGKSFKLKLNLKNDLTGVENEPVERCHVYADQFDDLFENGCGTKFSSDLNKETFHQFESVNDEALWHKNMKTLNKLMRKERRNDRMQLESDLQMDMPASLEMPSVLLNF